MKEVFRMCVSCRERKPKDQLIRFIKNEQGISIDMTNKKDGRGAYVCKNSNCIQKLIKTKGLNRAFKTQVNEEIYTELENLKEN